MARELITSWTDFGTALDRLLAIVAKRISIYDEDLTTLNLDSPSRLEAIKRVLQTGNEHALQIALRNAQPLRHNNPRLLNCLKTFGHLCSIQETPPQIAHLRDSMIIIDEKHALIRFDRDQPRSKLIIDEPGELKPYLARLNNILSEGGEHISAITLGL